MSNYVKATDFASKDALTTGNPLKLIKGTEINDELNAIQIAVATKADLASPAFTGNPTSATQAIGNNTSRLATTAFVQQEITATEANVAITGGTISNVAITGGTVSGLATDLAVADGGTGASTFTANSVVLGNATSSLAGNMVAPGTSGNILTSNGTTWASAAAPTGITPTSGNAPYYGVRAWCSFNGQSASPITPLAQGNISSITKTSAGNYVVNFTTAMPHENYAASVLCQSNGSSYGYYAVIKSRSTTSFTFTSTVVTSSADDPSVVCVTIVC